MAGVNDEYHAREALHGLKAIVADLVELAAGNPENYVIEADDLRSALVDVEDHIGSIRVKGDAARKAKQAPAIERVTTLERGDVPTYTKDGDRVS